LREEFTAGDGKLLSGLGKQEHVQALNFMRTKGKRKEIRGGRRGRKSKLTHFESDVIS